MEVPRELTPCGCRSQRTRHEYQHQGICPLTSCDFGSMRLIPVNCFLTHLLYIVIFILHIGCSVLCLYQYCPKCFLRHTEIHESQCHPRSNSIDCVPAKLLMRSCCLIFRKNMPISRRALCKVVIEQTAGLMLAVSSLP